MGKLALRQRSATLDILTYIKNNYSALAQHGKAQNYDRIFK